MIQNFQLNTGIFNNNQFKYEKKNQLIVYGESI